LYHYCCANHETTQVSLLDKFASKITGGYFGSSVVANANLPKRKLRMMTEAYSSMPIERGTTKRQFYFRAKSSDERVIDAIFVKRQYDFFRGLVRVQEVLRHVQGIQQSTGKKPLVIDAGANIGASSISLSGSAPDTFVVAIEPDPGNYQLLKLNTEGLNNVESIHAAVSSKPGRMRVIDPGQGYWGYRTQSTTDKTSDTVTCVTINDLYKRYRPTCFPFVAKIDIEGGEADLFSANTEWVERTPILIIELHDWLLPKSGSSRSFLRCISRLNRDFIYLGEDIYSISNDPECIRVKP
jgi:FkbM family methyltransferase